MHSSVASWANHVVAEHGLAGRSVLEVGSQNINGSVRDLFTGDYLAVDMSDGSGVDLVCDAHDLVSLGQRFEVVVSTEMLEHDSAPWLSVRAMRDVCIPGGWLLLTARGFNEHGCFPIHGYPEDHWRFSVTGMRHLLTWAGWHPVSVESDPDENSPGVLAVARAYR